MLALLLSALFSFLLFLTLGKWLGNVLNLKLDIIEALLIGLVVANTTTTLVSLFVPVNSYVLLLVFILSIFLFYVIKQDIANQLSISKEKYNVVIYSMPFIIIAFLLSLNSPLIYDTGLYHIQSIKWIEEYSVVTGLANLHGRFGFNSNIFSLFALTSMSGLFNREIFSINFTIFIVVLIYYINIIYAQFKNNGLSSILLFYIIIFLILIQLSDTLSSPSPDFLNTAIPLFIFTRIAELSRNKNNKVLSDYIPVIILTFYVITVKLSTLPLIILPLSIMLYYRIEARKWIWKLCFSGLLIFSPWLIRNILLSGWLLYPFAGLNLFHFDWQVPVGKVLEEKNAVVGWARIPGEHYLDAIKMTFSEWVPIWWQRVVFINRIIIATALLAPMTILLKLIIKKTKPEIFPLAIVFTSLSGTVFWFSSAPDFRFGIAFIIILALSPLLYFNFNWIPKQKTARYLSTIIILLFAYFVFQNKEQLIDFDNKISSVIVYPKKLKVPEDINFDTCNYNGVVFYFPTSGDRCFDYCIPCSPSKPLFIEMRGKTLKDGFRPK